ncbi:MAG: TonB-dependent receptor [Melioribacteraceae bacterium]|nr:TonB-dependent receptor [Melioribacteraceae bacterium]
MNIIDSNKVNLIRNYLIILCILFPANFLLANSGKISGKIIDAEFGSPLPGVNVVIVDDDFGAASDMEGDYFILNIPPGKYDLKFSMVGYKTIIMRDVEVSSNHTTIINVELEATILEVGEEVVVMANRPLVEKDQTSTRHFVNAKEISSRPAQQLTEILNTLPGIDQNAGGELVVRRGSLDQVSFLIDGIRARNPLDFEPYTNINLTSIQELEIITGGFNAEYGEARSGVFNIVTKDGTDNLQFYAEVRWTPAGLRHWGTAFYDYSTTRYWENTHARHQQWWVDHPDQWVDPTGIPGNDPNSSWTPEEAYQDYMNTHQPLNDYTDRSGYQTEISLGGPMPFNNMYFFFSGKFRTQPPVTGNSYREKGSWVDGTGKITYRAMKNFKFMLSGFYGEANTNPGMEYMNSGWVFGHGLENKYAHYDFDGYPESNIYGQTFQFTHVLSQSTFYELKLNRVFRYRSTSVFPGDELGWEEGVPVSDRLRAYDEFGNPVPGGFSNLIGLHTTGYFYRGNDENLDWTLSGDYTSQINKSWQLKAGVDFTYYTLNRFQEAKAFTAIEDKTYNPFEGNLYAQSKLEFEGLIINVGFRYDFYNPNDRKFLDVYDPFDVYTALENGREPEPVTMETETFGQFSPRLGISHPITENSVLHFSYGHFFQRAAFGNYGEGTGGDADGQAVSGILNTYVVESDAGYNIPYNLGNRDLKPRKTVAYELGIEQNVGGIVADITAYYKDITNTIRSITVITRSGGRYLTTGNGDYGDAKGIEISIRKPLTGLWGGYLNYSWSTGIAGRSGDPDVIAPPESDIQVTRVQDVGDFILYDPARLKFGLTFFIPRDVSFMGGIFSNTQIALDYQVYFPHERIASHVFSDAGMQYIRTADKNADLRIRKEFDFGFIRPAFFIEVRNLFNDTWANLDAVKSSSPEDRVRFINSGFSTFPDTKTNGAPFPDVIQYRNLPRTITFGLVIQL